MSEKKNKTGKNRNEPEFDLDICQNVQDLLFEYMSLELGDSRSALVREHLRLCPDCQAVAADIQSAFTALQADSGAEGIPDHLTEDRRKRLIWALMHPALDWIYRHHIAVSAAVMLLVLALIIVLLQIMPFEKWVQEEVTPTVQIGVAPEALEPEVPEQVEPPAFPPVPEEDSVPEAGRPE